MCILGETKASTARTFTADNHVQCLEIHRIALLCPLIHSYSCLNLRIMQSQQGTRVMLLYGVQYLSIVTLFAWGDNMQYTIIEFVQVKLLHNCDT